MVYASEHMVMQWGGSFRAGGAAGQQIEIFTGTLRFQGPVLAASNNKNNATALALVLARYWQSGAARIPTNVFLEYVKWNRVTVRGTYADLAATQGVNLTPVPGVGAERYPTQVAWATTWATDAVRGQAVRGRTFWPTSAPLGTDMQVSVGDCIAKAQVDDQLIQDLNAAARSAFVSPPANNTWPQWAVDVGWAPGTVSEGSGLSAAVMSKIGEGATRAITRAEVGQRLDIQRRRGNGTLDLRQTANQ